MKKIEYNSYDVILKQLVYFFSTLLIILLASTYLIAKEIGYKEVVTNGRAVIIGGNEELAKKRALEDALYLASLQGGARVDGFSSIDKMSVDDWDIQINTNLRPSFLLTRLFVGQMKKNKTGHLVFINSVAGKYGHSFSNSTAYVSSKYALKGFADSLRTELRDYNVKVSSIYPGAIDTEFWDAINVDFPRDEMLSIDDLSQTILHVIEAPNSSVIEDVVVRRTAGDF